MRRVAMSIFFGLVLGILLNISASKSKSTTSKFPPCTQNSTHSAVFGTKGDSDQVLYSENIKVGKRKDTSVTYPFTFPPRGTKQESTNHVTITYIEANDTTPNGKGGCVNLKSGGIGHTNVTIYLRTQKNLGMTVQVTIFGKSMSSD